MIAGVVTFKAIPFLLRGCRQSRFPCLTLKPLLFSSNGKIGDGRAGEEEKGRRRSEGRERAGWGGGRGEEGEGGRR